jgi:hypothetical protein
MKFSKGERRKTTFNRRHSWDGHIIKHIESLGNILEGAISGRKGLGKTSNTIRKASH